DGPRAILGAYILGIIIVFLYQLIFYSSLAGKWGQAVNYLDAFPLLLRQLFPALPSLQSLLKILLHSGIASSSLGAAYGIMFSNSWNLHALAHHNHIAFSSFFKKLNRYAIPYICVMTEAGLAITYLLFSQGNQIPLQQISSCGMTITYTLSALAFVLMQKKLKVVPMLGLLICFVFIAAFIRNILTFGGSAVMLFVGILLCGIAMFFMQKEKNSRVLS
ncbi:MAG TPA: hypothetical protein VHA52_08830, partial [Candidatus Babeliaceae bacterium]|nr:hypothetical protein [Candidatus Babeliaceae bacterium]